MSIAAEREPTDRIPPPWIAASASITILDGFDAFSLSLTAPQMGADLHIPATLMGTTFASAMGGMIIGAIAGGALADRVGRVRTLIASLALFGAAALIMPLASDAVQVSLNRLIAGIGLGAAAPIAVGLLNRTGRRPPSELIIATVVAGIPLGGSLAALFNYAFVPGWGWRSIFVVGGLLPFPIAFFASTTFRGVQSSARIAGVGAHPRVTDLFRDGRATLTLATAAMFFFGYVMTSIIAFWLPTILSHRGASALMIFITFSAINAGGISGMLALGFVASRGHARNLLPMAWGFAGVCGLVAAVGMLSNVSIALMAIGGYAVGAGGQALSVAAANNMHCTRALETTSVGFMTGVGRFGQACALGASGAVIALAGQETIVFAVAGVSACIAALLGIFIVRHVRPD